MESDRKDIIINGTFEQYRSFVEGVIWKDFQSTFDAWLSDIRYTLETQEDTRQIAVLQGNALAVRRILNLPSVIMEQIIEQLERVETDDGEE